MIHSWKSWWHSYRFGRGYEGKKAYLIVALALFIRHIMRCQICTWKGHNIVDESYAGPDTGAISGYCTRCEWHYHQILY